MDRRDTTWHASPRHTGTPRQKGEPDTKRSSHVRFWAGTVLLLMLAGCNFGAPEAASVEGRDISNLYRIFFYAAIAVGGVTYALIIWSVLRYRRRGDELPKQTRNNIPAEVTYTLIPLVIVAGLFVLTFRTEERVNRLAARPALSVDVSAFQWGWRFDYPQIGISVIGTAERDPTMVVPVGQTVAFSLASEDVIHAFYVPQFLFKRDTIPGITNRFDLVIPRAGTFRGECAEFCGLEHADMGFFVKAVSPAEFREWVRANRPEAAAG